MIHLDVVTEHANLPVLPIFSQYVRRALMTAFPYITGERPMAALRFFLRVCHADFLMFDSGIYTIVKDWSQGKLLSQEQMDKWTDQYIKLVEASGFKGPIVEVDAQKMGYENLDLYRKKFIQRGWKERTVFVWHWIEGPGELKALLNTDYPRIGLSWGEVTASEGPEGFFRLLRDNWDKLVWRHVHVLGSADEDILNLPDNFSCDSANWASCTFYGEYRFQRFPPISFRGGQVQAPARILNIVDSVFSDLVNVYKHHPIYNDQMVRRPYLRAAAAALYSSQDYHDAVRRKNPHSDMSIKDPLDYAKKYPHGKGKGRYRPTVARIW